MKSSEVIGFIYRRDAIFYEILQPLYFLPPINSSLIQHTFDIKNSELLVLSLNNTKLIIFLCIIGIAQSSYIT